MQKSLDICLVMCYNVSRSDCERRSSMLLQFNFKNFKSFKDDVTIDFTAAKIQEFNNHVIQIGNEKVLPAAAIFGANASGKSNVIDAFKYMSEYIIYSLGYGEDNAENEKKARYKKPTPFLFDSTSKNAASSFEVFFIGSEEDGFKTYNYGFAVDASGVKEEWLNYRSRTVRGDFKRVFYRCEGKKLDLSGIAEKYRENIEVSLNKETLVVSLGARLRIENLKKIRDWFLANEFADFGRPFDAFFLSTHTSHQLADDNKLRQRVTKYLSTFDPSIIGLNVERIATDNDDGNRLIIKTVHKMADSNDTATMPLQNESAGTLKMFSLYPMFEEVMRRGGIYFVDELNARLHPLLVRSFVIAFLDPEINQNHAQLVFTTHDTWQLDSNMLRRDEIWFTEKDKNGVSTLFSLYDFQDETGGKIRKDENYERNYMLGNYGAIPKLKRIDILEE